MSAAIEGISGWSRLAIICQFRTRTKNTCERMDGSHHDLGVKIACTQASTLCSRIHSCCCVCTSYTCLGRGQGERVDANVKAADARELPRRACEQVHVGGIGWLTSGLSLAKTWGTETRLEVTISTSRKAICGALAGTMPCQPTHPIGCITCQHQPGEPPPLQSQRWPHACLLRTRRNESKASCDAHPPLISFSRASSNVKCQAGYVCTLQMRHTNQIGWQNCEASLSKRACPECLEIRR